MLMFRKHGVFSITIHPNEVKHDAMKLVEALNNQAGIKHMDVVLIVELN